ncbi:MAG TPA: hypothetical protein VKB57_28005 [Acidimicrobiales bacterium]|nr:hypothetical protein [Acidimicrobiales bacterium]
MAQTETDPGSFRETWQSAEDIKRFLTFDLNDLEWQQVTMSTDGTESGNIPDSLVGKVDMKAYYEHGMWTTFVDAGAFNILGVKLAPEFTIPRHHHNLHQLVLVHEGEVWQGRQCFKAGEGYFTRAEHPYTVTAGPEGSTSFEIRFDPITELTLVWDDVEPEKWVHGRRPGGPAAGVLSDD